MFMVYRSCVPATFLARPNRFIARVLVDGKEETVHVKNTGRCKELLIPGVRVYLEEAENPHRKTRFSLIAVEKGERLINMDSQAPNNLVAEALEAGMLAPHLPGEVLHIKREAVFGDSRLDFLVETTGGPVLMEVKGVTLEEEGIVLFPDAPTQRGIRHLQELERAVEEGFSAISLFLVQMEGVRWFSPNDRTHPAFGETLRTVQKSGVEVLAYDCLIAPGEIRLNRRVIVRL